MTERKLKIFLPAVLDIQPKLAVWFPKQTIKPTTKTN